MGRRKSMSDEKPSTSSHSFLSNFVIEPPPNFFPSKRECLKLIIVLSIASSVAWTCNLFFNSLINPQTKPFCDTNLEFLDQFSDFCEPCPSNGKCYDGKLECLQGYRKHGKLCVEDGELNESAKKISERVEYHLCKEYAKFLCDGTGSIWVQEDGLWNYSDNVEPFENVGLDNVNYTKQRTIETLAKLLDMRTNFLGMKEFKCPDLLAEQYKPYACRLHQWISEHTLVLLPVCAMLVGFTILVWEVHRKLHMSRRVEELYNQACEILEENALMSKSVNGGEPWVVASQLRDHLLLPRERKDLLLWKKVEELVQEDSRVDRYPKLVKGESKVVWEWQVEGSLSSSRMKRKRDVSKVWTNKAVNLNDQHPILKSLKNYLLDMTASSSGQFCPGTSMLQKQLMIQMKPGLALFIHRRLDKASE